MRPIPLLTMLSLSFAALSGCTDLCPPMGPQPPGCGDTPLPNVSGPDGLPGAPTAPTRGVPTAPQPGGGHPQGGTAPKGDGTITRYLPSAVPIVGRVAFTDIEDLPLSITIMAFGEHIPSQGATHAWFQREQAKGAQHYSGVSLWNQDSWYVPSDLPSEIRGAYVTGFDGEPLKMQDRLYLNFLDPALRAYLMEQVKEHIDAGTNGFVFDEVSGTADAVMLGTGPFDEHALSGFRAYLQRTYDPTELSAMGIEDIATFDYREFLLDNGYRARYAQDYWAPDPAPLRREYYAYLRDAAQAGISEMIAGARAYAEAQGKTLTFTANADPLARTQLFRFYDDLTVYVFEHEWFPNWRKEQGSAATFPAGVPDVPSMKFARSLGTWAAAMPQILEMDHFSDVYAGSRFFTHEMAETYAAGGYYMYFPDVDYIGIEFESDRSLMYPYYDFVRSHPEAFLDLTTPAKVAVAKPFHVIDPDATAIDAARGFSLALYEANVPHDVILVEDVTPRYDVVLTSGTVFTDEEIETLLAFARAGGTVIAAGGNFATRDEHGREVARPALDGLRTAGTHPLGEGRSVFFEQDLPFRTWAPREPAALRTITDAVAAYVPANAAPANVTVLPYANEKDGTFVFHVLNYEFDGTDFSHRADIALRVKLPEGASVEGRTLTVRSPDFEGAQEIAFAHDPAEGWLTFTLPTLYVWDVARLA